jgi:TPR repeat protein
MLGWMLLEREIIEPDQAEARRWALAAAEQGVAAAMTRLGMIYHNALGVDRDPREAARWWQGGAERGDADGQAMLGASLHLGAGVQPDRIAAFVWLLRARAGGSGLAEKFFDAARTRLSQSEIAQAERLATEPPPEAKP